MTTRELQLRIKRLKDIAAGLDAELVSLAIGFDHAGLEQMAFGARAALGVLQSAASRLERVVNAGGPAFP